MCEAWGEEERSAPLRVADVARLAAERREELRAAGWELHPVESTSRKLASHFWGRAWMRHLACCESGGLCLAPGRSLLRHGCVLDVRVQGGQIKALVSAQELCEVELTLSPLGEERQERLRASCRGHIDSVVSLLEGRVDEAVLARLCDPDAGLLPEPGEWRMSCSCPEWTEPCPHESAVVYAVGVLVDREPSLLFSLRGLEPASLLEEGPEAGEGTVWNAEGLSSTFGVEIEWDD